MSATNQAQGLVPARHPSGTIRIETMVDGLISGGAAMYTGTPVKIDATTGLLIPCAVGADVCVGVFQGCEYNAGGKRFVSPNFPAGQTYDVGSMLARYTRDPAIIYSGQADGPVAATKNGEGINLVDASTVGNAFTGLSTQRLSATTTGATAATFQVIGLDPLPDNAWGDALTKVLVKISTYQGQIA
jgi:hypothetical protein